MLSTLSFTSGHNRPSHRKGPTLTEYRVALTLERPLDQDEIRKLLNEPSEAITKYGMEGDNVVMAHLHAPDSLVARETAEIHVLRATGVKVSSSQLLP